VRSSPISAVLLTNADVDHVVGLFSLREGERVSIHATAAVQSALGVLGVTRVLEAFCGVEWHEPATEFAPLPGSSLMYRAIPLPASPPRFLGKNAVAGIYSVAYQFVDEKTKAGLLVAPGVAELTGPLREAAYESEAVLIDGTFWTDDELRRVKGSGATAREMGHMPIKDGTLPFLRDLRARHKIYAHINNTNPIFSPDSAERAAVEACGVTIGYDGMSFVL
jgi:pyrroloquinoline quinone biosynthesis protein B